jgi:ABC-type glycerol-3-phosphate transport system substrate-binding protein
MIQKSKKNAYIFGVIVIGIFIVAIIFLVLKAFDAKDSYRVSLEMWGPLDDSRVYESLGREYRQANPFLNKVSYKKFLVDEYKADLLDALASGNGPDIFLIRNNWMGEFQDKVVPAPETILNEATIRREFVNVVADDGVIDARVFGVPLFVDSLALYYNKDLFDFAGITQVPETWDELMEVSRKLTTIDSRNGLTQSGIALGTARNINRSTDILNALLLQTGTGLEYFDYNEASSRFRFGQEGKEAIDFYMQFSNINSSAYTWNLNRDYSIDAFGERGTAMMINYSWHYDTIKRKNNRLNFSVAPLPQFEGRDPKNFPNYWMLVVAKNKNTDSVEIGDISQADRVRVSEAWQYLRHITLHKGGSFVLTNFLEGTQAEFFSAEDPAKTYVETAGVPAARRDLVEMQKTDPVLGAFATGNLLARSWNQGDAEEVERLMAESIDNIYRGEMTSQEAIRVLEERIRTYRRR